MPPSIAEGIDKLFCHNLFLKSRVSKRYFLDDFTEFSDLNYQKMTLLIINQIIIITNSPLILLKNVPPKKSSAHPHPHPSCGIHNYSHSSEAGLQRTQLNMIES
jgi:hypothetical protein